MTISQLWGNTFVNIFVFSFSMICEKAFINLISNFCDQDSFYLTFKDVLRLSIHWPRMLCNNWNSSSYFLGLTEKPPFLGAAFG